MSATAMDVEARDAILTIALLAAFADGGKDDRERQRIREVAESLASESGAPALPRLYQDVLFGRVTVAAAVAALSDARERQLAYEMAVCVADADGRQSEAERRFLAELRTSLALDVAHAQTLAREADAIAELTSQAAPVATISAAASADGVTAAVAAPNVPESDLDRTILNHAILCGALELLPQSWASLAIIPLQLKTVYRVGKAYGFELDQGHIREFLATAGVGLTSQYLEQFGRKLLGGLLGKAAGGLARGIGRAGASVAFSFATTYALGHVAKRYYAGGRRMGGDVLRDSFRGLLAPAKELQQRYLPQIQETASGLDAAKVMALVRGA